MLIKDIITKKLIMCDFLDYKDYNSQTFVISFTNKETFGNVEEYSYKSNHTEFGQENFEIVEDEEHYMYVTDKYLFICKHEDKVWCK